MAWMRHHASVILQGEVMLGAKHQFPTPHPPLQMCLQVMEGQPFHEKKKSKLDMRPKDASADILVQEYAATPRAMEPENDKDPF